MGKIIIDHNLFYPLTYYELQPLQSTPNKSRPTDGTGGRVFCLLFCQNSTTKKKCAPIFPIVNFQSYPNFQGLISSTEKLNFQLLAISEYDVSCFSHIFSLKFPSFTDFSPPLSPYDLYFRQWHRKSHTPVKTESEWIHC